MAFMASGGASPPYTLIWPILFAARSACTTPIAIPSLSHTMASIWFPGRQPVFHEGHRIRGNPVSGAFEDHLYPGILLQHASPALSDCNLRGVAESPLDVGDVPLSV